MRERPTATGPAMVADPEQMRFYPRPKTRDEVDAWLASNIAVYDDAAGKRFILAATPNTKEIVVIDADTAQALALWNLLGGYFLDRVPVLAGFVTVTDWEAMVESLQVIRDTLDAPE